MDDQPLVIDGLRLRAIRGDDLRALSRFYQSLTPATNFYYEPFADKSIEGLRPVVERSVRGEDGGYVLETPDGDIVAHVFLCRFNTDTPHLGIGLAEAHQGHGLGEKLVRHIIDIAKRAGKQTVQLTVCKANERALKLYTRCGFVISGDATFRKTGDSYEMQLRL